ncbi:hypothetical protein UPYG_G00108810 [Umbra pygmaea]|uniref:Uncharacterized protein n=1 Tax=Umbra pygmaea TaxID=75934 RepID=A0ABD0X6M3_UMBPY
MTLMEHSMIKQLLALLLTVMSASPVKLSNPTSTASSMVSWSDTSTSSSATPSSCTTRRCLASMLIDKEALTQPQSPKCISNISMPSIVYKTLSVDIKNQQFKSRLQIALFWDDPDLSWDTSVYQYQEVVLPVSKIWTPEFQVTNGVETTTEPGNQDLLVYSNGTVEHMVIMNTVVDCEVNLYKYPFSSDVCSIAINAWELNECGMLLIFGNVTMVDANSGDWITNGVMLKSEGDNNQRNYLSVSLTMRSEVLFLSLVLPSILIILSDIVSYALPLGGGERVSFKITLVLSFIMFLIILTNILPAGGQCSPLLQYHFCFCLVFLVVSTLQSLMTTRLANCGTLLPPFLSSSRESPLTKDANTQQNGDEDSTSELKASEVEYTPLQMVVKYLEEKHAEEQKKARHYSFANKLDFICFWIYLLILIVYTATILYLFFGRVCSIDHLDFWN